MAGADWDEPPGTVRIDDDDDDDDDGEDRLSLLTVPA
jgi:hypothetical protein